MRQLVSRLVLAQGVMAVACATAIDAPLHGDEGSGAADSGGSLSGGGSDNTAGTTSSKSGSSSGGNKVGGSGSGAFGGTVSANGGSAGEGEGGESGSATAGTGGVSTGGAGGSGGSGEGGKAGSMGSSGSATGGSGGSGGGSAGTGTGGTPPSTTCDGVADWTSKNYAIGDVVASTCSGPFAHGCPAGQTHQFECDPMAGAGALAWCRDREPGSGNGWWEAWVDKGECE